MLFVGNRIEILTKKIKNCDANILPLKNAHSVY